MFQGSKLTGSQAGEFWDSPQWAGFGRRFGQLLGYRGGLGWTRAPAQEDLVEAALVAREDAAATLGLKEVAFHAASFCRASKSPAWWVTVWAAYTLG